MAEGRRRDGLTRGIIGHRRFLSRDGIIVLFLVALLLCGAPAALSGDDVYVTVVYNNVACEDGLTTAWGMACVIEGFENSILFDTGGDGRVLLTNMRLMKIDPTSIDVVVLSHDHGDHTGGLEEFLKVNPDCTVYLLDSFSESVRSVIRRAGSRYNDVYEPLELMPDVWTTGPLGSRPQEQALILDTRSGLVVVTGCAHPGVDVIAEAAHNMLQKNIYLITGGFHLSGASEKHIEKIGITLLNLGVEKIAPSHCTGERAMRVFEEMWGAHYLNGGCGARFRVH
jgi:7,8-dihydropterin-6-yl-methyl-4-(beta-D-ribofuranosyl)aminobenzene 5'-phosphate synthase